MNTQIVAAIIQTVPQAFLSIAAVCAGVWAIYNFRDARRLEAARWMQQMYSDFYNTERFDELRLILEYTYDEELSFLVQKTLTDKDIALTRDEMRQLRLFDNFLNFFENILYLLEQKRVQRKDVNALFDFWFGLMRGDKYGALRGYLAFGFERMARELDAKPAFSVIVTDKFWSIASSASSSLPVEAAAGRLQPCDVMVNGVFERGMRLELSNAGAIEILHEIDRALGYDAVNRSRSTVLRKCRRVSVKDQRSVTLDAFIYETV